MFGTRFERREMVIQCGLMHERSVRIVVKKLRKWVSAACLVLISILMVGGMVCASEVYGASAMDLPWESPLKKISDSLSGPVAFSMCVLAIFAGGAAVAFGADLPGWVRSIATITLVAGLIGGSAKFLSIISFITAATVL
jgi:type IV secretion system protein VirB2